MLYCDLAVDSVPIWYGVPCLNLVPLKSRPYMAFRGSLLFVDGQGISDPTWDLLDSRYALAYIGPDGSLSSVPLEPTPAQALNILLDDQNCRLSIYERTTQ